MTPATSRPDPGTAILRRLRRPWRGLRALRPGAWRRRRSGGDDRLPIELYDFVDGATRYRYTSSDAPVTIASGPAAGTYAPEVLLRGAIQATDEKPGNATVRITLDRGAAVARLYDHGRVPDPPLGLTIYRYHRADLDAQVVAIFAGSVARAEQQAAAILLYATPIQHAMERTIPARRLQALCNHRIFDAGCGLAAAAWAVAGTLAAVSIDGLTLTIAAAAGKADQWFTLGYLVTADGRSRAIANHVGSAITLLQRLPESSWAIGDPVTLYPGCDRLYTTCRDKFANLPNFFGFPLIPLTDPFHRPPE